MAVVHPNGYRVDRSGSGSVENADCSDRDGCIYRRSRVDDVHAARSPVRMDDSKRVLFSPSYFDPELLKVITTFQTF